MLQPVDKKDVIIEPKDAGLTSKVIEEKDVMPKCKRAEMGMTNNCAICRVLLLDTYKSCPIKYCEL